MAQLAVDPELVMADRQSTLPDGYNYANPSGIEMRDLSALDEAVNGPFKSGLERASWPHFGRPNIYGAFVFEVGVVEPERPQLVGIGMLTLRHISLAGELSHLMVHPQHRRRGIAKSIIQERVRIADRLGATGLSAELAGTNTLGAFYRELGFEVYKDGKVVRRISQ